MIGQRIRLVMIAVVIVGCCLILFYRLWFLQIESQEEFINKQPVTDIAKQRVPGTRGRILDFNGLVLAGNETNMEIGLDFAAVEAEWNERERAKPRKERREIPSFEFGPRREKTTDIIALLNELVFPELNRLNLYRVPPPAEQEKQKRAIITSYVTNKGVIPFPYEKYLLQADEDDFKRFTAFAENAPNIPGLIISERPKRRYPFKALAGHLIGYIQENRDLLPPEEQKIRDKEIADAKAAGLSRRRYFDEADDFGMAGLEKSQEEKLRPRPGERIWRVNEHGRLTDEIKEQRRDPLPGADVFLTIDARIQYLTEMALRDSKAGRAAAVVIDPNTFAVLGIASLPSYDPNIFLPPKDNDGIKRLYDRNSPLPPAELPLALSADTPGSAFKLMTALAASISGKSGVIRPYPCSGGISFGNKRVKCMGTHGMINMSDAIMKSCNCYFMQLSMGAGIANLQKVTRAFNFGQQDFPQNSGIEVPDLEGNRNGRLFSSTGKFSSTDTALAGMGQGPINTTPLQLAMLAAAIGNGGKVYQPTLIHHYEEFQYDRDGRRQKVISEFKPKLLADLIKMGVKPKDLEIMREGMRKVVNGVGPSGQGGTGARARSTMCIIAGKTSTAQRKRQIKDKDTGRITLKEDDRVWFMAFAPYEKPTVAVAVMVINGKAGGRVAAPIAKRIIEQTLGVKSGAYQVKPQPLEPALGGYNYLEEVKFEGESIPPDQEEESPETPDSMDEDADDPQNVAPANEPVAPRAQVVPEEDAPVFAPQVFESVKFRLKSDPPNPVTKPVPTGATH